MMIRVLLIVMFGSIVLSMLILTTLASMDRSILDVGPQLTGDPWFHATLADAYFGFLTFYVWVAYKEPLFWRKMLWFVLIMTLGNFAMSTYVMLQLWNWDPEEGARALLCREPGR